MDTLGAELVSHAVLNMAMLDGIQDSRKFFQAVYDVAIAALILASGPITVARMAGM